MRDKGRIALFEWAAAFAAERRAALEAAGWDVEVESEDGERGGRNVVASPPNAVVFDLAHRPSHSVQTAKWLRTTTVGAALPFVFVDGDDAQREKVSAAVVDPRFVAGAELPTALEPYATPIEDP